MKLGLIEIIWLLDILNIQGLEYLDTMGPNGLGWTLIFISVFVFSFIIGFFTKLKEKSCCGNCSSHKQQIEYLEKRNDQLHEDLIDTIKVRDDYRRQLNEYRKDSSHFVNQLEAYQKRHEYDMRKREEAENKLKELQNDKEK